MNRWHSAITLFGPPSPRFWYSLPKLAIGIFQFIKYIAECNFLQVQAQDFAVFFLDKFLARNGGFMVLTLL